MAVALERHPAKSLNKSMPLYVCWMGSEWPWSAHAGVNAFHFHFLDPTSGLTTREPVCNVTQELKENRESKEWEPVCNVTWELKENRESKERPVAAGTVLGAGEQYGGVVPCRSGELELAPL